MDNTNDFVFHTKKIGFPDFSGFMKKTVLILLLISLALFLVCVPTYADDMNLIWKEAKKTAGANFLDIIDTRVAGKYAICGVLFKSGKKPSHYAYYFLKKKGSKWVFVTTTSPTATSDFLKRQGVPAKDFPKLIDKGWIKFTTPIIQTLEKKKGKGKYFYDTARVEGKWAVSSWTTPNELEGLALLKNKNGKWVVVFHGGGALSEGELKKYGVPPGAIKKFLKGKYLDRAILEASGFGNFDAVRNLISADPKLADVKNIYGLTPLHRAALFGRTKVVKILVGKGADINAKDQLYGDTPLHKAVWNGHIETVKFLVSKGAKVNAKDKKGRTPLYYAKKRGHKNIVRYLKKK
ncbi:MAG: ankyrin repeat domain-containing protein [Candidatus Eremiobacteraeota bacterium]|nr:ankyrin repeat domain-containing protein [Candidatus Eremiobacteraeota bacterium]